MNTDSTKPPEGEVRIGSNTDPTNTGIHLFELLKNREISDNIHICCVGPMALLRAIRSVIALNSKLAAMGEQVVVYPTYSEFVGSSGETRTVQKLELQRRKVKLSCEEA